MLSSTENGTDVNTSPAVEQVAPPSQSATEEALASEVEAARQLRGAIQDAPFESEDTAIMKAQRSQYSSLGEKLLRKCEFHVADTYPELFRRPRHPFQLLN